MNKQLCTLIAVAALAAPTLAQTEVLFRFDRPAGTSSSWGRFFRGIGDLDQDRVGDLIVGVHRHGGGEVATLHSGRTGAHLFSLTAPHLPMFFGDGIGSLRDETDDGIPELFVIGSRSGDANSLNGLILVYSGADGTLLRQVPTPLALTLPGNMQSNPIVMGDIDGDGSDDILCRSATGGILGASGLALLSSQTGDLIYLATPVSNGAFAGPSVTRISDFDQDGIKDFAVPARSGSATHVQIHSGATGQLLAIRFAAGLDTITGNGEPFLAVADADGDGLQDLATGAVFSGQISQFSSATGAALRNWDCSTQAVACFGSRLIEVDDMGADGHPDLIALESSNFSSNTLSIFGLDPVTGGILFSEELPALQGGYSNADRLLALPGRGKAGRTAFAVFEDTLAQISVRQFASREVRGKRAVVPRK